MAALMDGRPTGLLKKEVSNMKSLSTFLVAALMVLSLTAVGFAHGTSGGYGGTTAGYGAVGGPMYAWSEGDSMGSTDDMTTSGEEMIYSGTVVSMMDDSLVVKGNEGEKTFDLSDVTVNGALKPGDEVQVAYHTDENGDMVVSSVTPGVKTSMNNDFGFGSSQFGSDTRLYGSSQAGSGGVVTGADLGGRSTDSDLLTN